MQHDNDDPHMKGTPQLSLRRFSLFQKWWSIHNYIGKPFNPALTSLEEGALARIYTKNMTSSLGGAQFPRNQIKSADGESINADLKLNWAYLLTGGLIELTHQPIHRHISPQSIQESPHVWRREREGAIPHEDSCRSTLDLIWSPPSVKDLSDPVNLV